MTPVDEETVKATYERIDLLAAMAHESDKEWGTASGSCLQEFEALLADVKRALINPGGRDAATLLRALARLDAVADASRGYVPAPDSDQ